MTQPKLPGTAVRRRVGRHRRAHGAYASHARKVLGATPSLDYDLTVLGGLADELDALERDGELHSFVYARVAGELHQQKQHVDGLMALRAPDDAAALLDYLTDGTDLRNPAPS